MSTYTTTRDALEKAIQHGDPSCPKTSIHKRFRDPKLLTDNKVSEMFGETKADGTTRIHGWMFSRTGFPIISAESSYTDTHSQREAQESWEINGYLTFDDDTATEFEFQEIVDTVKAALFTSPAMLTLRENTCRITSLSVIPIDKMMLGNTFKCHWVKMVLTLTYPNYVL